MKQTFGVIVTNRSFFPAHLVATAKHAVLKKLDDMGYGAITVDDNATEYGAIVTYEEAKICAALFKAHEKEISGIIVILPNFGEETGVADAIELSGLDVPVLIQACDDDLDKMDMSNRRDAFCGKLSVCNNLYQSGIKYSLTTHHTCAIDSDIFTQDIEKFAAVCRVVTGLKGARIAAIGSRPNAFRTVRYSEKLLQQSGISIQTGGMAEIIAAASQMKVDQRVLDKVEEIKAYGSIPDSISEEKVLRQAKLCLTLEDWITSHDCVASSIECWDSIQNNYGCATCLAMSMMGDKGMPSSCELDVTGAVTMYAMRLATGQGPAYLDWNNNWGDDRDCCVSLHCSNFPKSFFQKPIEISNLDVLGTTIGADKCFGACKAQVASGPMTFAKITTDDKNGKIKCYVGEGDFRDDPIPTKGGLALCHVEGLQDLMHYICNNGFEHHVAICRGHVADILEEALGNYMGFEVHRHK